jgi:hypothetical protein
MWVLSKLATRRILAVALAIPLVALGVPALHAEGQQCPSQVTKSCTVHHVSSCPSVQKSCTVHTVQVPACPSVTQSCVDKKAQHEAEEAAKQAEKDAKRAAHEAEESAKESQKACEKQAKAEEHAAHEAAEAQEKAAKAVVCTTCTPVAPACPAPEISAVEPTPAPEAPSTAAIIIVPAPQPEPSQPPKELPRTASPMELVGLVGLLSMSGFATGYFRRRK